MDIEKIRVYYSNDTSKTIITNSMLNIVYVYFFDKKMKKYQGMTRII